MFNSINRLEIFQNLEELDLSMNKITDLLELNIQNLTNLRIADFHKNLITNSLEQVSSSSSSSTLPYFPPFLSPPPPSPLFLCFLPLLIPPFSSSSSSPIPSLLTGVQMGMIDSKND